MPGEQVPFAVLICLCPRLAGTTESALDIPWKSDCVPEGREAQGLPSGREASQMYKANPGQLAEGSWGMVAAWLLPP